MPRRKKKFVPSPHLSPEINARLQQQEELGTIEVFKLKKGTVLEIITRNSTYLMKVLGQKSYVEIQGGTRWPRPTKVWFSGSNFGGSMLAVGAVGPGMHMELVEEGRPMMEPVVTSSVRTVKVKA